MTASGVPKGLICSLALVSSPRRQVASEELRALVSRLHPHVAGIFLDPMFWHPDQDYCGPVSAALLEEATTLLPPGLPLWVRVTGKSADQTIHICQQLETLCRRLRFQGPLAWVDTPLLYHSNRGLTEHYERMLRESQFPLLLDNDPDLIGRMAGKSKRKNIRTAILKRLAQNPSVAGLLHRGDLRRSLHYQRAVRARADFLIYDASERHFLQRPSASGVLSIGANLLPAEWRLITQASVGLDERNGAEESRFRHLWEVGQRVRTLHRLYSPAPTKVIPAVLAAWGLSRGGQLSLSADERKAVQLILEQVPMP
jgi:dihydrodipicolinate synthase/N-acetylneuraminate lyase